MRFFNLIDHHPAISIAILAFILCIGWLALEIKNIPYCDDDDF